MFLIQNHLSGCFYDQAVIHPLINEHSFWRLVAFLESSLLSATVHAPTARRIISAGVLRSPSVRAPLWSAKGSTGPGQTEKDTAPSRRMTDDRNTTLRILEEPRMRREEERLRTFHNWPTAAPVTSAELAKAGFFFLGSGDKVQCFCCGGILRYWVRGDSPAAEHRRHFPTCSFVAGRAVGNVPLQPGSPDSVDGQLLSQLQRMTMDDQSTAGQAVYPEMEAEDSRLTTFHNWPTEASVQPDVLARAGFFYTGAHGIIPYLTVYLRVCLGEYSGRTRRCSLCERVRATIVLLNHELVDRMTWTKLGLLKKSSSTASGNTHARTHGAGGLSDMMQA